MDISNIKRFESLASGIQSVLTAIAIVVGGVWGLWTLHILLRPELAQADLNLKQMQLATTPVVNIELTAAPVVSPEIGPAIDLRAVLKNTGSKGIMIDFRDRFPFNVGKLDPDKAIFVKRISIPVLMVGNNRVSNLYLRAGAVVVLHALSPAEGPGTYMAEFYSAAPVAKDEKPYNYYTNTLVVIPSASPPNSATNH